MKAVARRDGRLAVVERPEPRPGPEEATVRVDVAGICGTDLEIALGYMDFDGVLGHEFVGVVESAPDPSWIGRRVVAEINVPCGECATCSRGEPRHCPSRTVLGISGRDGAFARRVALPVSNLHAVPEGVSDEAAVFTEPLAAAHRIVEQVRPSAGIRALVLGDGRLGQLCASALARAGCPPRVCGRHPAKLARLRRMGFEVVEAQAAISRDYDLVVEATGSPDGLRRALGVVRPRGTVVLKSTCHGDALQNLAPLVVHEITVVGSRCGPFEPALRHLAADASVTDGLVTARYPLEEAAAAFARAAEPDALKVLLLP